MGCGTDNKEGTTMPAYKDKAKGTWYAVSYTHLLEKDVERSDKEHKEIVSSMQEKIDKLETECSRLSRITYMQSRKILVISNSLQQSFAGVMVLPYDRITELNHMVGDYSEILYVPNDMPFPSRRYIQKLDYIQEKLHVFCTHAELIDYLENGR